MSSPWSGSQTRLESSTPLGHHSLDSIEIETIPPRMSEAYNEFIISNILTRVEGYMCVMIPFNSPLQPVAPHKCVFLSILRLVLSNLD